MTFYILNCIIYFNLLTVSLLLITLILILQSREELESFKEKREAIQISTGNKIFPYVACIGDLTKGSESDIEVLLIINNTDFIIKTNSIVDAIDYCFKSQIALKIDFAHECKHVWMFLQKMLYKIDLDLVKPYNVVNKLIDDLEVLKDSAIDNNGNNPNII